MRAVLERTCGSRPGEGGAAGRDLHVLTLLAKGRCSAFNTGAAGRPLGMRHDFENSLWLHLGGRKGSG